MLISEYHGIIIWCICCNLVPPLCFSVKVVYVWFLCRSTYGMCADVIHRLWLTVLNIGQTPVESCGAWQWLDIANSLSFWLLLWQTAAMTLLATTFVDVSDWAKMLWGTLSRKRRLKLQYVMDMVWCYVTHTVLSMLTWFAKIAQCINNLALLPL